MCEVGVENMLPPPPSSENHHEGAKRESLSYLSFNPIILPKTEVVLVCQSDPPTGQNHAQRHQLVWGTNCYVGPRLCHLQLAQEGIPLLFIILPLTIYKTLCQTFQ